MLSHVLHGLLDLSGAPAYALVALLAGGEAAFLLGSVLASTSPLGRRVGQDRWARGEQFLIRRGGPAVLLGRWVGVLRALIPSLAGMARMPYRQFLAWNALGGALFAGTVVLAGYTAGNQYAHVAHLLGGTGLLLLSCLIAVALVAAAVRSQRVHNHPHATRPQRSTA